MNYSQYCLPSLFIISQLHCITAQGGTIGGHYRSHLLYRSPKGGPLVDITTASYCIAAQRGDHWWTSLQPVTVLQPKGRPLVDTTMASYCITAQGGTIGEHYRSHLLYHSPRGDHWWTSRQPVTVSQPKGGPLVIAR